MENEQPMTSARVASNVREIRKARGYDLSDVSDRLTQMGQPISVSGLSKLETGSRRVDVDDLVALALVLDVSPVRLLLTATADPDVEVKLAPDAVSSEFTAWQWATGASEFNVDMWSDYKGPHFDFDRSERFREENQPHVEKDNMTLHDVDEHREALRELSDAAQIAQDETGLPLVSLAAYIKTADFMRRSAESMRKRLKSVTGEDLDNG